MPRVITDWAEFSYRQLAIGTQSKAVIKAFLAGLEDNETLVLQIVVLEKDQPKRCYFAAESVSEVFDLLTASVPGHDREIMFMVVENWDQILDEAKRRLGH